MMKKGHGLEFKKKSKKKKGKKNEREEIINLKRK